MNKVTKGDYKMKTRALQIVILVVVFLVSFPIYSHAASGWKGPMKVVSVVAHGNCYLIDTNYNLADCGANGRFTIKIDAMMSEDIYKMAMTAWLAQRDVYIYADDSQSCLISGMVSTKMIIY